jgi:capsular exopolysaccharide synthesis family protein
MTNVPQFPHPGMENPDAKAMTAGSTGGVIDVVELVVRNKILLAAGLMVGVVLGYLAYKKLGPVYNSSAQILVSRKVSIPIQEANRNGTGDRSAHVAIIMSPLIVTKAIEKYELQKLPTLAKAKDPVEGVLENLKVTRSAGDDHDEDNVFSLTYRSSNEKDANTIVDAVISSYEEFLKSTRQESSRQMLTLIKTANEDLGKELDKKRTEYLTFRQTAPLVWKSSPGVAGTVQSVTNVHQDQLDNLAVERRKISLKQLEIQTKMQALQHAQDSGESPEALQMLMRQFMQSDQQGNSQTVIAGPTGREGMESQLVQLLLDEQNLLKNFGPRHPDVQNKQQQIAMLTEYYRRQGISLPDLAKTLTATAEKRATQKETNVIGVYIEAMRQQAYELTLRDQQLELAYNASSKKAQEYGHYHIQDKVLSDEIARLESLYSVVEKQLREIDLVKESNGYRMQTIAPARSEVDFKRILKFIGGGGFAGFGLVFAVAYLLALQDTTVKSMNEVRDMFPEGILGTIPTFQEPSVNLASARATGLDPMLYYFHQPGSAEAESIRSARTTIYVRALQDDARVLQMSSCEPHDGKSTTISNLAISIAQSGKRVLLIDADLRRPTIHKLFGLDQTRGLSTVLSGQATMNDVAQSTVVQGLTVVTAGALPDKPAELLASTMMRKILEEGRNTYDVVLVDTPPVLSVSDPCIVAPYVDGLLLVVRMQKNRHASLVRVRETLRAHGVRLLGVITNGSTYEMGTYEYKGEYAGNYGTKLYTTTTMTQEEFAKPQLEERYSSKL